MAKNETLDPELFPGNVRLCVQIYDNRSGKRMYRQPPGMSISGVNVKNKRELKRLMTSIRDLIDAARWRDLNQQPANG